MQLRFAIPSGAHPPKVGQPAWQRRSFASFANFAFCATARQSRVIYLAIQSDCLSFAWWLLFSERCHQRQVPSSLTQFHGGSRRLCRGARKDAPFIVNLHRVACFSTRLPNAYDTCNILPVNGVAPLWSLSAVLAAKQFANNC